MNSEQTAATLNVQGGGAFQNGLRLKSWRAWSPLSGALVFFFGSGLFQEKAITPDESLSLAGTDWLIGNHSDELTPWIPVMAARQVISSSI